MKTPSSHYGGFYENLCYIGDILRTELLRSDTSLTYKRRTTCEHLFEVVFKHHIAVRANETAVVD